MKLLARVVKSCSRRQIGRQSFRCLGTGARLLSRFETIGHRSPFPVERGTAIKYGCVRTYANKSAENYPEHLVITMPALSPTMTTGNIGQWKKHIGDTIAAGDVLCEIETDKAQMDLECQEEGILAKTFFESGSKDVPVNTPLAIFVENKEDIDAFKDYVPQKLESKSSTPAAEASEASQESSQENSASAQPSAPSAQGDSQRTFASPLAKTLANELGIKLQQVPGSGPNGRVVKDDVLGFKPSTASPVKQAEAPFAPKTSAAASFVDIPLTNMRKVIASRLLQSKQQVPHYYLTISIKLEKVLKLREVLNAQSEGQYKLSINDFIIRASALSLKKVPQVNSAWYDTFIRQYSSADVSVAVATEAGLITPIIASAESKGLATISNSMKELAVRAKENKLKPEEYQGGTFTISNLGMMGIDHFTAIINPPQSCILAIGTTKKVAVPCAESANGFRFEDQMSVTLSCDHRVVDGAVGSKFLAELKRLMEQPLFLLL